jgi:DNA primase large subunit
MAASSEALKKYPFLVGADSYVAGLSLSNIGQYPRLLALVERKVRYLLKLSEVPVQLEDKRDAVALFGASLALVSASGNRRMIRTFALALSRELEENLARDMPKNYVQVAASLGIRAEYKNSFFEMRLPDYLKLKGIDNDPELLLPQLPLKRGVVRLSPNVFRLLISRVFRRAITEKMEGDMPTLRRASLDESLREVINSVALDFTKKRGEELDVSSVSPVESLFPPCVKFWVSEMKKGINIPHQARFLVATFLLSLEMSVDEVLEYFKQTPDYDERIARYQVEDLAGEKGSGKKYSVPRCDTLRTSGVCVCKEGLCSHMSHPLLYYRISVEKKLKGDKFAGTECSKLLSRVLSRSGPRAPRNTGISEKRVRFSAAGQKRDDQAHVFRWTFLSEELPNCSTAFSRLFLHSLIPTPLRTRHER